MSTPPSRPGGPLAPDAPGAPLALVRRPTDDLADGLVTFGDRLPVDVDLAHDQHTAYCRALGDAGWRLHEVEPAPGCPDAVFVEDTVVVVDGTAVITRPGAPSRRPETVGTESAVRELGLDVVRVDGDATLDGGDVLQVGRTVYVGRSARTNPAGVRRLREVLTPLGRTVVPVRLVDILHLKSAVTALPDGSLLAAPRHLEPGVFATWRPVEEEAGCHVAPLDSERLLISASAPRTADRLADLGFTPLVVDISEFEKLEGCVTCLSVRIPAAD
jgi:dimethylargininase